MNMLMAATLACCGVAQANSVGRLIEPDRVADIGTQAAGVFARLSLKPGDTVAAGQVFAYLTNPVERASVSLAESKAKADAEVQQPQAAYERAQPKFERSRDLLKRDFVSDPSMGQSEAEARVAHQRVAQATQAQRVAQREVRSPFVGSVVERYRREGARVEREPVVRVARMDPLRVKAIVPGNQFGAISAGQLATVKTEQPDHASLQSTVRVRLTLASPGHKIPAGLRCCLAVSALPLARVGQLSPDHDKQPLPRLTPSAWDVGATKEPSADAKAGPAGIEPLLIKPAQPARPGPSLEMPAPPMQAQAPGPRIVSSTLRVAMTQLGRMTPGAAWLPAPQYTMSAQARAAVRAHLPATPFVFAQALTLAVQTPVVVAEADTFVATPTRRGAARRVAKASLATGKGVTLASMR